MIERKAAEIADISNIKLSFTERLNLIEIILTDMEKKIRDNQHVTTRKLCAKAVKEHSGEGANFYSTEVQTNRAIDAVLKTPRD